MRATLAVACVAGALLLSCASDPPVVPNDASVDAPAEGSADAVADQVAFPDCFFTLCDGGSQYCPPDTFCSKSGYACSECRCLWNAKTQRYYVGCGGPCGCLAVDSGDQ